MKKLIAFLREEEVFELVGVTFLGVAAVAAIAICSLRFWMFIRFWAFILAPAAIVAILVGVAVVAVSVLKLERKPRTWHL